MFAKGFSSGFKQNFFKKSSRSSKHSIM